MTAVFCLTGGFHLWRWLAQADRTRAHRDRSAMAVDLNHAVMSVAMVVMVWWPPGRAGTWFQVAAFAVLGLTLGYQLLDHKPTASRLDLVAHVITDAAMVWLLAAMPVLMPGMSSGSAMDMPG